MCEELRRVALILGAVDGDVVNAARRLVRILRVYQWATEQLSYYVDDSVKKRIYEEVSKEVKANLVIHIG